MAWMMELMKLQTFNYVRASFMIAGHTKVCVDRLFSQIAQTFYHSDVFNTQELAEIISNYVSVTVDNGKIVKPWTDALSSEYKKLPWIRSLHDSVIQ